MQTLNAFPSIFLSIINNVCALSLITEVLYIGAFVFELQLLIIFYFNYLTYKSSGLEFTVQFALRLLPLCTK